MSLLLTVVWFAEQLIKIEGVINKKCFNLAFLGYFFNA